MSLEINRNADKNDVTNNCYTAQLKIMEKWTGKIQNNLP